MTPKTGQTEGASQTPASADDAAAPTLSVVIRTRNRAEMLRRTIESIQQQQDAPLYEIVVVDNNSADHTAQTVRELAEESAVPVRYVHEPVEGLVPPLERGIAESRAPLIAFCDDDQTAAPDWLRELMAARQATGADYIGGSILLELPPGSARPGPVARYMLGEHAFEGPARKLEDKAVPSLGNMLIARELLRAVGPFDPQSFCGGEDTDYTARVRRAGHGVFIAPAAVVFHIIPPHRLHKDYLCWVSRRWGSNLARRDAPGGGFRLAALAVARLGQALCLRLPRLIVCRVRGNAMAAADAEYLLHRAWSYARSSLTRLWPGLFPQPRFHASLEISAESRFTRAASGAAS